MFDLDLIRDFYNTLDKKIDIVNNKLQRPLTFTEKVLFSHIDEGNNFADLIRGSSYIDFFPDRVAMQDATAQMALLQFMQAGKQKVAVPTTVHCDHLILAQSGAKKDLQQANKVSSEVFDFLESTSKKYNWEVTADSLLKTYQDVKLS